MRTATIPETRQFTFDDFCLRVKDGEKADLIDGVIYMASPDNLDANRLFVWLLGIIDIFAEEKDLGEAFGSRAAFRLDKKNGPEPDIAFVRKKRLAKKRRGHFLGPPDAAFEIVSPESIDRDYNKKRRQYERFGVEEYWIIDEIDETVTLLRRGKNGKYREVRPRSGIYSSTVLTGFWFRPEWLWQTPRPKKLKILKEIMAGKP